MQVNEINGIQIVLVDVSYYKVSGSGLIFNMEGYLASLN
jgi:hypothetical protein